MRPLGTAYHLQKRREYAIKLLRSGKSLSAVARAVSADPSSVLRWQRMYREQGRKGLRAKPVPGRPPHLSSTQRSALVGRLLDGPLAAGYKTDLWTLARIARLIKQRFGITYHPGHVWKLL
jgi:transposase